MLDKAKTNPTALSRKLKSSVDDYVAQSVMARFLKGSDMTYENAKRLGRHFGFDPRALTDPDITEDEAVRIGLIHSDDDGFPTSRVTSYFPSGAVYTYSDTNLVRAPAVEWARLETDLKKGLEQFSEADYFEFLRTRKHSENVRLVMVQDDSLGPRLRRGDLLAFDLENKAPERNQVALFKSGIDGAFFIRRFVPVAGGRFDAIAVAGEALNSDRDQLEIIGSACGMAVSEI